MHMASRYRLYSISLGLLLFFVGARVCSAQVLRSATMDLDDGRGFRPYLSQHYQYHATGQKQRQETLYFDSGDSTVQLWDYDAQNQVILEQSFRKGTQNAWQLEDQSQFLRRYDAALREISCRSYYFNRGQGWYYASLDTSVYVGTTLRLAEYQFLEQSFQNTWVPVERAFPILYQGNGLALSQITWQNRKASAWSDSLQVYYTHRPDTLIQVLFVRTGLGYSPLERYQWAYYPDKSTRSVEREIWQGMGWQPDFRVDYDVVFQGGLRQTCEVRYSQNGLSTPSQREFWTYTYDMNTALSSRAEEIRPALVPNPWGGAGALHLQGIPVGSAGEWALFDTRGHRLYQGAWPADPSQSAVELNLPTDLPSGYYLLRTQAAGQGSGWTLPLVRP